LGDHGEETHGLFAYESTIRIPLIMSGPGLQPATVTGLAAQADLLPTIADLVGIEPSVGLDGRSLLPSIRGEAPGDEAIYFEALDAHLTRNWAPLTGIVSDGWKYIDLPIPELFDLSRDPGEQANRAAEEPDRTTALARRLEGWKSAEAPTAARELDPDAAARLRSLGYTASSAPTRKGQHTEADDPKRLVDVDRRFQTALHLVGDGRHADAAALAARGNRPTSRLHGRVPGAGVGLHRKRSRSRSRQPAARGGPTRPIGSEAPGTAGRRVACQRRADARGVGARAAVRRRRKR